MTTPTEPAARLTVEPAPYPYEGDQYTIKCEHGGRMFMLHNEYKEQVAPSRAIELVLYDWHKEPGCHCADAIRARYGAGGEGER